MSLTLLTDHTSTRMRALDEHVVQQWNQQHADRPVRLVVADHEALKERLEEHLTAADPPDVMTWLAGNRMRRIAERGLMLDLGALWRRADLTRSYEPRFRAMAHDGGTAAFLPTSHYWWAVYYRPSLFASLGIGAPIRTWTELERAVAALQAAGIAPLALGAQHGCAAAAWFDYLNLRLNGPAFHAALMATRVPYTHARVRAVFTRWQRMLDDGWFLGAPAEYDEQQAVRALLEGRAGMTLIGSYVCDEYVPDCADDLDFFRVPLIDPAVAVGEDAPVDGYFAAGRTTDPAGAIELLAHLGSAPVQQSTVEALHALPTRTDIDLTRGSAHVAKGLAILRGAQHVTQFYDLDTPWEIAAVGVRAFLAFLREPARAGALLHDVDDERERHLSARAGTEGEQR
jgi:ABC-type glycerol-3-phosphate transport system substrate-binding protein